MKRSVCQRRDYAGLFGVDGGLYYLLKRRGHAELLVMVDLAVVAEGKVVVLRLIPETMIQRIPMRTSKHTLGRTMAGRLARDAFKTTCRELYTVRVMIDTPLADEMVSRTSLPAGSLWQAAQP